MRRHVLRNAVAPLVAMMGMDIGVMLGGILVIEKVFAWPGVGSLAWDAILRNDTPVIMSVTFVFACLVILFNLFADLLYGWLDPRISYR